MFSEKTEGKLLPPLGDLNTAEAVLKAWASCQPAPDCSLPEGRLLTLLPAIAAHVPGGKGSLEKARFFARPPASCDSSGGVSALRLYSNCTPVRQGNASFLQSIQPQKGKVHFPYFWRAFSEAVQVVGQPTRERGAGGGNDATERTAEESSGLARELEALRDNVLRLLEDSSVTSGGRKCLSMSAIAGAVRGAVATSVVPDFWRSVQGSVNARGPRGSVTEFSLEEVSALMLLCLRGAVALRRDRDLRRDVLGKVKASPSPSKSPVDSPAPIEDSEEGLPVYLNIYDVSHKEGVQWFNAVLAHWLAPVKLGGAFHAGVEVHGLEWSYGATRRETLPGLICVLPRADPNHHFRQTVYVGRTKLSMEKVASIITDLIEDYPGNAYDVLRRNCCHFADDFCHRLGVGAIPAWVQRLARLGVGVDGVMQSLSGVVPSELLPAAAFSSLSTVSGWEFPSGGCSKDWPPFCLASAEPVICGKDATCPGPL